MTEIFSALIALVEGLSAAAKTIKSRKEKRLARDILQIHLSLQSIIDDAFIIFDLISNAESKMSEYGASQYSRILRDNFQDQANRIRQVSIIFRAFEMATIVRGLDRRSTREIWHLLGGKSDALYEVLFRIHDSSFKVVDDTLYLVKGRKKSVAFPNIGEQYELLRKLQDASTTLSRVILARIKYTDLI